MRIVREIWDQEWTCGRRPGLAGRRLSKWCVTGLTTRFHVTGTVRVIILESGEEQRGSLLLLHKAIDRSGTPWTAENEYHKVLNTEGGELWSEVGSH